MAENLLVCEQVVLLAYDPAKGRTRLSVSLGPAVAGAVLLDLLLAELVEDRDGLLAATGPVPRHPAPARFHRVIAASRKPRTVRHWVAKQAQGAKLERAAAVGLVERGVLREERRRVLGILPVTRYPQTDPEPGALLLRRLHRVLLENEEPSEGEALLVGVLKAGKVLDGLLPKDRRKAARDRAAEVATAGLAVNAAVAKAVRDVELAVMAAAVTASVAASSGS